MRETTATQYLKMIWLLEEHDRTRVSVTALTANLARSPATVSQAIRGLTDAGLIRHKRYGPITLTSRGRDLAITAIRQERITRASPSTSFPGLGRKSPRKPRASAPH